MNESPFTTEQEARILLLVRQELDAVPFSLEQNARIEELIDSRWNPLGRFLETGMELAAAIRTVGARRNDGVSRWLYDSWLWRRRRWGKRSSRSAEHDGQRP